VLILVVLVAGFAKDFINLRSLSLEDVVETGREIAAILPEDWTVVAAEPYYFGMPEHRNFVGGAAESFMLSFSGIANDDAWPIIAPDAIVFSSQWDQEPARTPALSNYLDEHEFRMFRCWETTSFGHIELWVKSDPPNVEANDECTPVCNPRLGCVMDAAQ
jgi:hypothetical protein